MRFEEYVGSEAESYTKALVEELLAHVDETYRTVLEPGSRGITGVASGAAQAVYAAFSRPEVFGRAAVQSYYFGQMGDEVKAMIADGKRRDLTLYVAVSSHDYASGDVESAKEGPELVKLLRAGGYEPVVQESGDGAGWASWASRTDWILEALFPKS